MEIWHSTFLKNLEKLLQDFGKMEAKNSDPDGSYNIDKDGKTNIDNEFAIFNNLMNSGTFSNSNVLTEKNGLIKIWLIASITKILKEQTGLNGLFSSLYQKTQ